jgi:hypothetical protein
MASAVFPSKSCPSRVYMRWCLDLRPCGALWFVPRADKCQETRGFLLLAIFKLTFSVKARAVVRCFILLCASGPCGLELDGTGGPLAKRLQVEDQPLDSLMAYDIKCFFTTSRRSNLTRKPVLCFIGFPLLVWDPTGNIGLANRFPYSKLSSGQDILYVAT